MEKLRKIYQQQDRTHNGRKEENVNNNNYKC